MPAGELSARPYQRHVFLNATVQRTWHISDSQGQIVVSAEPVLRMSGRDVHALWLSGREPVHRFGASLCSLRRNPLMSLRYFLPQEPPYVLTVLPTVGTIDLQHCWLQSKSTATKHIAHRQLKISITLMVIPRQSVEGGEFIQ